MIYAVVHTANWDTIRTYPTLAEAEADLLNRMELNGPAAVEELGLRPYDNGHPAGDFVSAADVLGERLAHQQHLAGF
jgi:hypothetical protein